MKNHKLTNRRFIGINWEDLTALSVNIDKVDCYLFNSNKLQINGDAIIVMSLKNKIILAREIMGLGSRVLALDGDLKEIEKASCESQREELILSNYSSWNDLIATMMSNGQKLDKKNFELQIYSNHKIIVDYL